MIDRNTMRCLRSDLELVLKNLANQYDLEAKVGNGSFLDTHGQFKIEFFVPGKSSDEMRLEQVNPSLQGRIFKVASTGRQYKIMGMRPRGRNVVVEHTSDKKRYTMKYETVLFYVNKEKP